jgi:hypothetical protein
MVQSKGVLPQYDAFWVTKAIDTPDRTCATFNLGLKEETARLTGQVNGLAR